MIVYSGNSYRREVFKWNFAKNNEEFGKIVSGLRAIGGTTNTEKALELALDLMETRNKSIPTLIMVVTDGRSAVDPSVPAKRLQSIPNTWVFAAATGDPQLADRSARAFTKLLMTRRNLGRSWLRLPGTSTM